MAKAKTNQVRKIIELFCKILDESNVFCIKAEILRQAKFNKDSATVLLWKLLFNIVNFCKNCSGGTKFHSTGSEMLTEADVILVKSELQKWGYLSLSFSSLPHDLSGGSRELLLAIGWVIHIKKVFDLMVAIRKNPLHQELACFLHHENGVNTSLESSAPKSWVRNVSLSEKIQWHLMLCGKLRMSFKRLYALHQEVTNYRHTISTSTEGVSLQASLNHLSPLEVYLLRDPDSLNKMIATLEKDNEQLQNLLTWKESESVFWEWMESVLDLSIQENSTATFASSPANADGVYLPLPKDVASEVTIARAKLRDFILGHEANIEKMEQLIFRKRVTPMEVDVLKHQLEPELSSLDKHLAGCWLESNSSHQHSAEAKLEDSLPDHSVTTGPDRHQWLDRRSRGLSAKALKNEKHLQLLEAAKKEMSRLEGRVHQLEQELRRLQLAHLHRFQDLIGKDAKLICVHPRYCKQLLDNS